MRRYPYLYEVNACIFVKRMSQKYGQSLTLATVPDEEWQVFSRRGFDSVWLMGVWQRSPGARKKALLDPSLRQEYDKALPGWTEADVAGSPYAVYSYDLDHSLGEPTELTRLKSKLNQMGLRLILDFVPNHLSLDHLWTFYHPERFVQGKEADVRAHPDWFFSPTSGVYLAHGRDPNFPPWTDTVQLNFYSVDLRQALIKELLHITEVADGVRCDMAMLALNDVFGQVWEKIAAYPQPEREFWVEAIERVKAQRPDFLFLAEAYWGLEHSLLQLGFDFAYDKALYDLMRFSGPNEIRNYLTADLSLQQRSAHFIENHDEARAIVAFGHERSLAAAAIMATIPGLRLFHDGQFEGRRIHTPAQLVRETEEAPAPDIMQFYERLLSVGNSPAFRDGEWRLIQMTQAEPGNDSHQNLLAWCWQYAGQLKIAIINYSPESAQGWLKLTLPAEAEGGFTVTDELTGKAFTQAAGPLGSQGMYLNLDPWHSEILGITPASPGTQIH